MDSNCFSARIMQLKAFPHPTFTVKIVSLLNPWRRPRTVTGCSLEPFSRLADSIMGLGLLYFPKPLAIECGDLVAVSTVGKLYSSGSVLVCTSNAYVCEACKFLSTRNFIVYVHFKIRMIIVWNVHLLDQLWSLVDRTSVDIDRLHGTTLRIKLQ